jgi:hypothetical protein
MLVKQQKCDTVSHKQHQAAKLAQNKSALTHSQTPMPQQYADFDDEKIQSFSINLGFQIDVIYIPTISAVGIYEFVQQKLTDYLLGRVQFVFIDTSASAVLTALQYACVMVLFADAGYLLNKALTAKKSSEK